MSGQRIRLEGMAELIDALSVFQERSRREVARMVMNDVARKAVVPIVREEIASTTKSKNSPWRRPNEAHPNLGKRGGPMERRVAPRVLKRRGKELYAMSVGSRVWYDHFVAGGTRAHIITARSADGERATTASVRLLNRIGRLRTAEGERTALKLDRIFVHRVHHPGARSNDYVGRSTRRVMSSNVLPETMSRVLVDRFEKKLKPRTRKQ